MGDRATLKIQVEDSPPLYFYTHWSGFELPVTLRDALIRGESCWEDDSYLARIIFCEMVNKDIEGTTGYGISSYLTEHEYEIEISVKDNKIELVHTNSQNTVLLTFQEYIDLLAEPLNNDHWERLLEKVGS